MKHPQPVGPFRKPGMLVSMLLLAVMLLSCGAPGLLATPTAQPAPILPPLPDTPTPVPPPTETLALTPTPRPSETDTPTPTPGPVNIVFATGATAAVEQGTLQPNQVRNYTLSAGAYQPMILLLSSTKHDLYLGVSEPDGNVLLDPARKWNQWQWLLPKTEVYTIQVYGGATDGTYTLTAKVAKRIAFASGATSISLKGSTPKGFVFTYALACKAGQSITVSLDVPASAAYLDVFGLATGPLLTSGRQVNTWTGDLPATEDYIIEVIPANGQVLNYTLKVEVE